MKKLVIILIALLSFGAIADAQVSVTKKTKIERLISLRGGYVSLSRHNDLIYLSVWSDNRFDEAYIINLGRDKATAMQSLEALIEIANTIKKDESIDFNDGLHEYYVYRGLLKGEIWIKANDRAGYGITSKGELKKILDHLTFEVY